MPKKLTKQQSEDVEQIMNNRCGDASLTEWLSRCVNSDEPSQAVDRMLGEFPNLPRGLVEAYQFCLFADNGWDLVSNDDWLSRGLARRFALEDPGELQMFISMHVRIKRCIDGARKTKGNADEEYVSVWDVLKALAVRDIDTARCWARGATYPLGSRDQYSKIYNGVFAILRDEFDSLDEMLSRLTLKPPSKWIGAMLACLLAIVKRDKAKVADAIETMLRGYSKTDQVLEIHKAICFEAHGFYALCHLVDPDLVELVKVDRDLPWDQGLWSITYEDSGPYSLDVDLTGVSQGFHDTVVRLEAPVWWAYPHERLGTM